jgi:hypothetical protein
MPLRSPLYSPGAIAGCPNVTPVAGAAALGGESHAAKGNASAKRASAQNRDARQSMRESLLETWR